MKQDTRVGCGRVAVGAHVRGTHTLAMQLPTDVCCA